MITLFSPAFARRASRPLPSDLSIDIHGRTISVRLRVDPRARRLTLRIPLGAGGPVLTVPPRASEAAARTFLTQHSGWLAERLARRPIPTPFVAGNRIPLRGVPHEIQHTGRTRGLIEIGQDDTGAPLLKVSGDPAALPRRVRDFLRREATRDLTAAVGLHAGRLGVAVRAIRLRDTISRWGSCTSDGTLAFSWRIIFAPPFVLDYLVAHEVAHLVEMNHSPAFWRVVSRLSPHARQGRAWLREHGATLHAIGTDPTSDTALGPDEIR